MPNLNNVYLCGYNTRPVELRFTKSGMPVTDISLAINEKKKNREGEIVEETVFIDVTLWGNLARIAHKYVKKGEAILICGRLKLETWEKDGQRRSKLKVVAQRMQRLTRKSGDDVNYIDENYNDNEVED